MDSGEKLLDPAGAVSGHLRVRAALTLADRFFVQRVGAVMDACLLYTSFAPGREANGKWRSSYGFV